MDRMNCKEEIITEREKGNNKIIKSTMLHF